jgi:hypothetical protein
MRPPRIQHSPHTGLILFGGTALIALRLFESGKLKRAWGAAISGPGTPPKRAALSTPAGSGEAGSGPEDTGPGWNAEGSQFGLHGVTKAFNQTGWLSADQSLFPGVTKEWNYLLAPGSHQTVTLPPGPGQWEEVASYQGGGVGGIETWRNKLNGAVLSFLHLFSRGTAHPGTTAAGGTAIGTSGWPLDPSGRYGPPGPGNAHLAVVANKQGEEYLG